MQPIRATLASSRFSATAVNPDFLAITSDRHRSTPMIDTLAAFPLCGHGSVVHRVRNRELQPTAIALLDLSQCVRFSSTWYIWYACHIAPLEKVVLSQQIRA